MVHLDHCSAVVSSKVSPHYLCVLLNAAANGRVNQCHSSSFPTIVFLYMVHTLQLPMSHLIKSKFGCSQRLKITEADKILTEKGTDQYS